MIISTHKYWQRIVVLSLLPLTVQGSTVVIIVTQNSIVMAGDSLVRDGGKVAMPTCKTRIRNRFVFGGIGLLTFSDPSFDIWATANHAADRSTTVTQAIDGFIGLIDPILPGIVNNVRMHQPDNYAHLRTPGANILCGA